MANKLTIDEGNSSMKLAIWRNDEIAAETVCAPGDYDSVAAFVEKLGGVDAAIFCSVHRRYVTQVVAHLERIVPKVMVLDAFTPLPIKIGYRTPCTLGVDRIAAAAGAAVVAPGKTALVVDLGTAITYDVLMPDGEFVGGNIAPGIYVRLEALNHFTKALPLIETDGDCPRWGYDTETAMRSGAIRGVVGELQYYRHCLPKGDSVVILTGGSAELILPYISSKIIYEPNLVLIGLNSIINYNEAK